MEKSYETCIELLTQRGYTSIDKKADEDNEKLITALNNENDIICVYFCTCLKLNKQILNNYLVKTDDKNSKHLMIVFPGTVTNITSKSIEQIIKIEVELFCVSELQFNITKHRLQPKSFEKLDKKISDEYIKQHGNKFPLMLSIDPISRFFNYKKGDMIRIINKEDTISYRIVK